MRVRREGPVPLRSLRHERRLSRQRSLHDQLRPFGPTGPAWRFTSLCELLPSAQPCRSLPLRSGARFVSLSRCRPGLLPSEHREHCAAPVAPHRIFPRRPPVSTFLLTYDHAPAAAVTGDDGLRRDLEAHIAMVRDVPPRRSPHAGASRPAAAHGRAAPLLAPRIGPADGASGPRCAANPMPPSILPRARNL